MQVRHAGASTELEEILVGSGEEKVQDQCAWMDGMGPICPMDLGLLLPVLF